MFPIRDHNPSGRVPYVTYALIVANVLIFISYWHLLSSSWSAAEFYYKWGLIPARISAGENEISFITSMFLHGGIMHLLGNMLFLFIFGDNMEDEMGHAGFLIFYLLSGLGAAGVQYVSAPLSQVPMVGASGAIAGVMGGYLLLYPKARVDILIIFIVFFKIIPIPAWLMLALWFAMQLFGGFTTAADGGGVAYWAHAGGFVAGILFTVPFWLREGGTDYWEETDGHPPHPDATYSFRRTRIPRSGGRR